MQTLKQYTPGLVLVFLIAVPAWLVGKQIPIIGSPVLAILIGMILAQWKRPVSCNTGLQFTSKKLLQYAIILLGFEMNLFRVLTVGRQTLVLMIFTLSSAFIAAFLAGRLLQVHGKTRILIGVGSAICGGSAIAATAPVIQADDDEIAHAISTIFLFNVIAAFIFPLVGHVLGLDDYQFGLWAGTAINDTSSVVAAGFTYSQAAGNLAVIVKLTRTLMIIPITLVLALFTARQSTGGKKKSYSIAKIFPWFVLGFAAASVVSTIFPIPAVLSSLLAQTGKFLIVMAMAAIGLNTNLVKLVKSGARPILLGFICWAVLAVTSLVVQKFILG